jgi:hypothetical protein
MRSKCALALGAALLLAVLTSCGSVPLRDIRTFGVATSALADEASDAFDVVNEWSARRKIYDAAHDPTMDVDTTQIDGPNRTNLRGIFDPQDPAIPTPPFREQIRLRVKALGELGAYAAALESLVTADVSDEIDEASLGLRGSLVSLRESYHAAKPGGDPIITDDGLDVIATAVNAIGKTIAEAKRREALRDVIEQANPAVQEVSALLAEDFGPSDSLIGFMEKSALNARGSLQIAYQNEKANLPFDERVARLEELRAMYIAEITMTDYASAIVDGAHKVGTAHQKMYDAVMRSELTVPSLRRDVEALVELANDIKAFREKLQNTN